MPESTIFGLAGLAAMLVIAFYFAYPDQSSPAAGESSSERINDAHRYGSQKIETRPRDPPFQGEVGHRIRPYFRCPRRLNREPITLDLERFGIGGAARMSEKYSLELGNIARLPEFHK